MGTFDVSLRAIGDVKALPARVELEEGRISIAAGSVDIGSWSLSEVHFDPIPTGYRMAAEGEQILIEMHDVDSFYAALQAGRKRRFRRASKPKMEKGGLPTDSPAARGSSRTETTTVPPPPRNSARPAATHPIGQRVSVKTETVAVALPPRDELSKSTGWTEKGLAFVDGTLERANRRFGPYLPDWVFTRVMFLIAFGALILAIIFPGLVSSFLLIAGALMVVFGAIVYSDQMLASRWLPGRTTPTHALLFGVAILMLGVLLGVVAR
ncbi:MAG TPA: hypothetical protein VJ948_03940 [Acidimicrobiia bacterium]|nr:hypothetical protein [Acidimicrobiia bacterium]